MGRYGNVAIGTSFGASRMNLSKELLFTEAENAGISTEQAQQLWTRLTTATEGQQTFDAMHVAYYFGGMIVIGAMTFFFSLAWERVGGAGILALALAYGCLFGFLVLTCSMRADCTSRVVC
jgi:hypothetical protein